MLDSQAIGTRIRHARELQGISQGDFAEMVERDQRTISEYENGKRRISAIDLMKFAQALGVSVLFFYEGEITASDYDRDLLEKFHRLTDATKADAIQMLASLAEIEHRRDNPS